jgi:uncharacterized protein YggT (Ycf19 family)
MYQPVHVLVSYFFGALSFFLIARFVVSWLTMMLPISPGNPIVRFIVNVSDAYLMPIQRRMPRMVIGMFDVGGIVAYIFMFWLISQVSSLILTALPRGL